MNSNMNKTMNTEEALQKIEEINTLIQSSNRAVFSGRHMTLYGIIVLLIPLIGWSTKWLTFGYDFGSYTTVYTSIANTGFFWGLSIILSKILPKTSQAAKENQHPLITKAFSIAKPIQVAIIGVVLVFSLLGQGQWIYPIVLILLGILFSIFGKFTIKPVSYFASTYIACGLLHAYLNQYDIPHLGFYFLAYNGISYLLMGWALSKEERAHG